MGNGGMARARPVSRHARACPAAIAKTATAAAKRLAGWRMRRDTPSNAVGAHLGATCDRSRPSALLPGVCLHVTNPTHPGLGPVHPRAAGTQRLARSEAHTSELQ